MRYYDPPNPYSFGDTAKMERMMKKEKENFKREELQKEEGTDEPVKRE